MTSTTDKKCQCCTVSSTCSVKDLKASFVARPSGKELKETCEWCDPKYIKLIYFNGRGRAEVSRLMMAYAEMPYIDVRMTDDWANWKKIVPFGQLPCMIPANSTDIIAESRAVERYIAAYCGLLGHDPLENARIDMFVEGLVDLMNIFSPIWHLTDEEEKKTKLAEKMKTSFAEWMEKLTKCVKGDYVLGSHVSYADFALVGILNMFISNEPKALEPYKTIKSVYERVCKLPKVAEWIKMRPTSQF
eukprot:TRINITY_DN38_c0_g1_i1.p1 TRINITY_DN38_c0_g1~~TRINITY_DN38_c0_g1_i1.p1  ORF type:complete len:246 (-),score=58.31 TRINITY_DN38_c0_g1_i1:255-992(-)